MRLFGARTRTPGWTARGADGFLDREFVEVRKLMGYSSSTMDSYRSAGVSPDRILKARSRPTCPVQQATNAELIIIVNRQDTWPHQPALADGPRR
jgi:hypothetical protein